MIDFGDRETQLVERMRSTTNAELAVKPLVDDNNLLRALRTSGFLKNNLLIGYLPAVIYEDSKRKTAELFVAPPLGEQSLTITIGGASYYDSTHMTLIGLYRKLPGGVELDHGHVVETKDGNRFYLSGTSNAFEQYVRDGDFSDTQNMTEEFERLGLSGTSNDEDYIDEQYDSLCLADLSFTKAIREAAKWVGYTKQAPRDNEAKIDYPRTLTFDEATTCLRAFMQNLKARRTEWDITTIRQHIEV